MNCSNSPSLPFAPPQSAAQPVTPLAAEAGLTVEARLRCATDGDPIAEWLGLMEVVQMLCPAWPVRTEPLVAKHWKL